MKLVVVVLVYFSIGCVSSEAIANSTACVATDYKSLVNKVYSGKLIRQSRKIKIDIKTGSDKVLENTNKVDITAWFSGLNVNDLSVYAENTKAKCVYRVAYLSKIKINMFRTRFNGFYPRRVICGKSKLNVIAIAKVTNKKNRKLEYLTNTNFAYSVVACDMM